MRIMMMKIIMKKNQQKVRRTNPIPTTTGTG
jgi:hypothetical protein